MLVLKFKMYDSFFIDDIFYQILPDKAHDCFFLRSQNGIIYSLKKNVSVELFEDCEIKLSNFWRNTGDIKICFDAPKHIEIVRDAVLVSDNFQDKIVTPKVTERVIDQLLEEEFFINSNFAQAFISGCFSGFLNKADAVRATYRSARQEHSGGDESDLIILIEQNNKTYALMIENKINADKQDRQPERYIERGINGIRGELWDSFETCLIAPEKYLENRKNKDYYHNYISYEEVIIFLEETIHNERRLKFRKHQFKTAISKREKFIRAPDIPEVVKFVDDIKKLSHKSIPELKLEMENNGAANNKVLWFHFSKDNYPDGVEIILQQKAVVAQFKLPKCDALVAGKEAIFKGNKYEFLKAKSGKSCTIRKAVDPINCLLPLESQKKNLIQCMSYIQEMDIFLQEKIF
jgi:sRNA-binding carbon storage regulator CsrA